MSKNPKKAYKNKLQKKIEKLDSIYSSQTSEKYQELKNEDKSIN